MGVKGKWGVRQNWNSRADKRLLNLPDSRISLAVCSNNSDD